MNQPRGLLKLLKFDSLRNTVIEYVETRIELIKADMKDNILVAMRAAVIYGSIAVLGLFFVLFLSLSVALALNAALDSTFWGFVIVTGFYLLMLVSLFLLRNSNKVKMMFGDGSLAFLKKHEAQKAEEKQRRKEKEKAAEQEEEEPALKHERVTFEHNRPMNGRDRQPAAGQPANIRLEKDKDEAL